VDEDFFKYCILLNIGCFIFNLEKEDDCPYKILNLHPDIVPRLGFDEKDISGSPMDKWVVRL